MDIFREMAKRGHEQVIFNYDKASGLKAIIAIHDTTLGPAIGGCRMWPYENSDDALEDALRLSESMTYKAAAAGLDFGGGKTVIIGDPSSGKSEGLFRALGRFVQTLQGRVTLSEDVGTNAEDFVHTAKETPYVVGLPTAYGGSGDTRDVTALGVIIAMRAALAYRFGSPSLSGRTIAVQGLGKVGLRVVRQALSEGASVIVADINPHAVGKAVAELNVEPTDPWAILETPCDIFAPCALGNVVNEETLPRLKCAIIAGSANNQLSDASYASRLRDQNILYAPDFIVNSGGLIQVADELKGYRSDRAHHQVEAIYDTLTAIFTAADEEQLSTLDVAMRIVDERLDLLNRIRRIYRNPS
ncbi:MAG: leucine dehydrogenase [Firmicutes bacterium]|jgi:leucine dehydrogenase|nr:leucine dehydrogenase [Bacillota bacterium]MCL5063913.1 leucine dehydrogenase [Bacillota bacterium]